ncbi:MAG: ABC transporter permease [Actinobacteria bacterium]|nr:ABC transporter permease [Actinomycetota bacterium]MBW3650549.1 ABC transporter permease [Actinomycetota bacterium]
MSERAGPEARILERGYRRFEGVRQGRGHAMRSLMAHTLRRILGLRRPARAKVLPLMSIVFAYLPATVFLGVVALFGRFGGRAQARQLVPDYADYYGFIVSAIVLFVAFAAPEALCPDRRSGVLSLYLASPLTRMTYLAAKAASVAIVIGAVTVGPLLLLLAGLTLQGVGPDGPIEVMKVLGRIVAAGVALAAVFTAISMAVASLTDRRALASAGIIFLLLGSGVVGGILVAGLGAPAEAFVVNVVRSSLEVVARIYGESDTRFAAVDTAVVAAGTAAWALTGAAVAVLRYRRLQVTR